MKVFFRNMKGKVWRKEKVQLIQVIKEKEKTWKEAAAKVWVFRNYYFLFRLQDLPHVIED